MTGVEFLQPEPVFISKDRYKFRRNKAQKAKMQSDEA